MELVRRVCEMQRGAENMRTEAAILEKPGALSRNQIPQGAGSEVSAKHSGYRLVGTIGVSLVLAVYLLLQLHQLPSTSLGYSVLNVVISLLVNVSSSAVLKIFSFLIRFFGLAKWLPCKA